MSVLVHSTPKSLTADHYDESVRRMEESGGFPPEGMELHVCYGTDGNLRVIEVWDSVDEWATYAAEKLDPVLRVIGIEIEEGEPEVLEVHNLVRR